MKRNKLKNSQWAPGMVVACLVLFSTAFLLSPQKANAQAALTDRNPTSCNPGAGGSAIGKVLPPWYKYLPGELINGKCKPKLPETSAGKPDIVKTVTLLTLTVLDFLTRVAGFITVGYIIWGGIQYTLSQGEPEGIANAKNTITNAVIGFVIVVLAIGLVQVIGNAVKV